MPSALLFFYTSEGFLVAADGRMRSEGAVLSDSVTKIFSISAPNVSLAYAFAGSVAFTDKKDPSSILFDLREEAVKVIQSLRPEDYDDLTSYAGAFSRQLYDRLVAAKQNESMERFKEEQPYIAYLFFAGYFAGQASWVTAEFLRDGQTPLLPVVRPMRAGRCGPECRAFGWYGKWSSDSRTIRGLRMSADGDDNRF